MMLIQIILVLIAIVAIFKVSGRYRAEELTWRGMALWVIFWLIVAIVALQPDSTMYLARLAGVGRGADLIVYLSLALIFFVLFRIMVKMEGINRDITSVTRVIALMRKDGMGADKPEIRISKFETNSNDKNSNVQDV